MLVLNGTFTSLSVAIKTDDEKEGILLEAWRPMKSSEVHKPGEKIYRV